MHKERVQSNGPDLAAEETGVPPARSPQSSSEVQTYFVVERTEEEEAASSSDRSIPGSTNVSVPSSPNREATVVPSTDTRNTDAHNVKDDKEGKEEQMADEVILVEEEREASPGSPLERNDLMIVEVEPMEISAKEASEEEKEREKTRVVPPMTALLGVTKEAMEKADDDGSSDSDIGGEDVEIVVEGEEMSDEEDTTTANTTTESVRAEEMPSSALPREEEGEGDGASNALRTKQSARVKQFFTTLQKFGNNMSRDGADQVQELISALLVSRERGRKQNPDSHSN